MILVISGCRHWNDYERFCSILCQMIFERYSHDITKVIFGDATGVDAMAAEWSKEMGFSAQPYKADWDKYRKLGNVKIAGPIRNQAMANDGDFLVAFPSKESRGTINMIEQMAKLRKPYLVWFI